MSAGPYRESADEQLERAMIRRISARDTPVNSIALNITWEFECEGGQTLQETILLTDKGEAQLRQICKAARLAMLTNFDRAGYHSVHKIVDHLKWCMCLLERQGTRITKYVECDVESNTPEQRFSRSQQCEKAAWDRTVAIRESTCRGETRMHNQAAERKAADKREELRIRAALAALTGLIARSGYGVSGAPVHAKAALEYADAFVAATEKKEKEEKND